MLCRLLACAFHPLPSIHPSLSRGSQIHYGRRTYPAVPSKYLGVAAPLKHLRYDLGPDPRLTIMTRKLKAVVNWRRGISGGRDHWKRAEDFLAKRQSGEVDRMPSFRRTLYKN
jgi:hypothetical protein